MCDFNIPQCTVHTAPALAAQLCFRRFQLVPVSPCSGNSHFPACSGRAGTSPRAQLQPLLAQGCAGAEQRLVQPQGWTLSAPGDAPVPPDTPVLLANPQEQLGILPRSSGAGGTGANPGIPEAGKPSQNPLAALSPLSPLPKAQPQNPGIPGAGEPSGVTESHLVPSPQGHIQAFLGLRAIPTIACIAQGGSGTPGCVQEALELWLEMPTGTADPDFGGWKL